MKNLELPNNCLKLVDHHNDDQHVPENKYLLNYKKMIKITYYT